MKPFHVGISWAALKTVAAALSLIAFWATANARAQSLPSTASPTSTTAKTDLARCFGALNWRTLPDRIDITHTLNTNKEVAQPAFVQLTRPDSGRSSGTVSGAVRYNLCDGTLLTIGPFAEYQWSNVTDRRLNTLRAGLSAEWQVREISASTASNSPLLLTQANFRSDREANTEGVQLVAQLTWVFRAQTWPAPNATWRIGRVADFVWSPQIGVIVDHVEQAASETSEGTIVRGVGQVDASLFPAGQQLGRRLELFGSYVRQRDLSDPTSELDDDHAFARFGANVFFVRDATRTAGVSVVRVRGEDPARGFARQRYWQVGLTLRLR